MIVAYPNTYPIGMSNLGFQTMRRLAEQCEGWRVERLFTPHEENGPPRTLESAISAREADVLAYSLSTESDLLGIARSLWSGGIPHFAKDRTDRDPIVLVGGAVPTLNPEPLAEIADLIAIGEGEPLMGAILEEVAKAPVREEAVRACAELTGVYAPALHGVRLGPGGAPIADRPSPVTPACGGPIDLYETASDIVTPHTEFADLRLVEIARGCSRGCRFCVAPRAFGRARFRSVDSVLALAEGERRIGLLGAAAADHPDLRAMLERLLESGREATLSASRAEALSPEVLDLLGRLGQRTLTLAPETTEPEVARRIGKRIPLERVIAVGRAAAEAGLSTLKLYFMLGLPGASDDEAMRVAAYAETVAREVRPLRVIVSAGPFVPKPRTPLEREPFADRARLTGSIRALEKALRRSPLPIEPRLGSVRQATLETLLSRSDRRLGKALRELAIGRDHSLRQWVQAMERHGLDAEALLGAIPDGAPTPWSVVG